MRLIMVALLLGWISPTAAQNPLQGRVMGSYDGVQEPLAGANVFWVKPKLGTTTNDKGQFIIDRSSKALLLVVQYLGFETDTFEIDPNRTQVEITLNPSETTLNSVEVLEKVESVSVKYLDVNLTENISEKELFKAACCDLSESFETNPSVDASFTDAVTGTRQIRMLGLDGPYSTYTRGNIRTMSGLASVFGLALIPGSWIKSIQLTKGTGSILNGYSSVTGQINYELRDASDPEKLFLNGYVNGAGRLEQNLVWSKKLSEKWGTALLVHGRQQYLEVDRNDDSFLDTPFGNHFFIQNTWKRTSTDGLRTQFGVKYSLLDQTAGQTGFKDAEMGSPLWGFESKTERLEGWWKGGYVLNASKGRSFGFQSSLVYHNQTAAFGALDNPTTDWSGEELSGYVNGIYATDLNAPNQSLKAGISYVYHAQNENYNGTEFDRAEQIPGVFSEYTWAKPDRFSIVLGLRVDQHNYFGTNISPRLHTRWVLNEDLTLRASAGKAYRTANIFAEHIGLMANNRQWIIASSDNTLPYGLDQEEAWNFGASLIQNFEWDYRPATLRVDYYYTDFQNQIVTDLDASARKVQFYNLDGRSFSHSFQVQFDYEVVQRLDVRLAYRFLDVQSTFGSGQLPTAFISPHRAFTNLSYQTRKYFKIDLTVQWEGTKRLPYTGDNSAVNQIGERSPDFVLLNLQISKEWKNKGWEAYTGVENLTNFKMTRPIISASDPFDSEFDASMVWGPVLGRMFYAGFRFKLLRGES